MLISVVTPHFNGSRFLKETAQSLLDQSHQDWEWIIVDDGSDREELAALETLSKQDDRITWQPRQGNPKGANRCRNQGWKLATGSHVMFLDSDDLLLPHALKQRCEAVMTHHAPDFTLLYFQTVTFHAKTEERYRWDDLANPVSWLSSLWSQTPPCQSSGPLWTKAALDKVDGWSEDIQVWQDIDIHQRAYFSGIRFEPAKTTEPDLLYRIHDESLSHNRFHSLPKLKSRVRILHDALQHATEHGVDPHEQTCLARMTWSVFRNACNLHDYSAADGIIKASRPIRSISSPFLSRWRMASTIRMHKVPFICRRMENVAERLFPRGKRTILTTPYP